MKRRTQDLTKSKPVTAPELPVPKRELTEDEADEVRALQQRLASTPKPPSFALGNNNTVTLRHDDVEKRLLHGRLAAALGVTDARALTCSSIKLRTLHPVAILSSSATRRLPFSPVFSHETRSKACSPYR